MKAGILSDGAGLIGGRFSSINADKAWKAASTSERLWTTTNIADIVVRDHTYEMSTVFAEGASNLVNGVGSIQFGNFEKSSHPNGGITSCPSQSSQSAPANESLGQTQ